MALNVYNGKLYGAAIPRAEVFRYERDRSWTQPPPPLRAARLAAGAGAEHGTPPDGDRRMREWTRVTSLTQHDGLLFASVGSCTSAAVDAPADVRGTVHAFARRRRRDHAADAGAGSAPHRRRAARGRRW